MCAHKNMVWFTKLSALSHETKTPVKEFYSNLFMTPQIDRGQCHHLRGQFYTAGLFRGIQNTAGCLWSLIRDTPPLTPWTSCHQGTALCVHVLCRALRVLAEAKPHSNYHCPVVPGQGSLLSRYLYLSHSSEIKLLIRYHFANYIHRCKLWSSSHWDKFGEELTKEPNPLLHRIPEFRVRIQS